MYPLIISITCSLILSAIFIVSRYKRTSINNLFLKIILSLSFVIGGLISTLFVFENFLAFTLIVIGLLCYLINDIFIELQRLYKNHKTQYLNASILISTAGQLFFLSAILILVCSSVGCVPTSMLIALITALVITALVVLVSHYHLNITFGKFLYQTSAYIMIISIATIYSLILSFKLPVLFIFVGAFFFIWISSIIYGIINFDNKEKIKTNKILQTLYYTFSSLAQILIILFIYIYTFL